MIQPDFGTAVVYLFIFAAMLFMGKVHWKVVLWLLLIIAIAAPVLWFSMKDYQQQRILSFFNPSAQSADATMQVDQAKLAIGSGQFP